jgi:hypothetical protein
MGISKTGRRKITREGKGYLWFVAKDPECCDLRVITVMQEDKGLIIKYPIDVEKDKSYVVVLKDSSRKLCNGCWSRYWSPRFCHNGSASSATIKNLLNWILDDTIVKEKLVGWATGP